MIEFLPGGSLIENDQDNNEKNLKCYCLSFHCERSYAGLNGYMKGYSQAEIDTLNK